MTEPLTFFCDRSAIMGFVSWESYLEGWTRHRLFRLGGRWWRIPKPLACLATRVRRLWHSFNSTPATGKFPLARNSDDLCEAELENEYVFPLCFFLMRDTLKLGGEGPLGIFPLPDHPNLYRLEGNVLNPPIKAGEGWLAEFGHFGKGFSSSMPRCSLAAGDRFTAEGFLYAFDNWLINGVVEQLLRHEHDLAYYRWKVEETERKDLQPDDPESATRRRIALRSDLIGAPGRCMKCRCLGEVPPPASQWEAFSIARATH